MDSEKDESVWSNMEKWFAKRTAQNSCPYLIDHIRPTDRILDVGCGVGTITTSLAKLVPQGNVVGIDIAQPSLAKAATMARSLGISNVHFQQANAKQLQQHFDKDSFDVIHSHNTLMHIDDPVRALREQRALLKDGGFLAARDLVHLTLHPTIKALDEVLEIFYSLSEKRGAHGKGRFTHEWAHEVGFAWERISAGTESWHVWSSEDKKQWAASASGSVPPEAVAAGIITAEMLVEYQNAWAYWAETPNSRLLALDGWILCQK